MKTRDQIEEKYKWDLSCFEVSPQNFSEGLEKLTNITEALQAYAGKIKCDDDLVKILQISDDYDKLFSRIYGYVHSKCSEDTANSEYDEMSELLIKNYNNFDQKSIEIQLYWKKLPIKKLDALIKDSRFAEHTLFLQDLKEAKKHQLKDDVDKFLAGADFMGGNGEIRKKFADADLKFPDVEDGKGKKHALDESVVTRYLQSDDGVLRKNALKALHGTYGKYINMLSANYIYSVKETCFMAKAYKYSSALDQAMHAEKVDKKVYQMLIDQVHKNLPLLFEYFDIKRAKLGLKQMWNYDTYVSPTKAKEKKYTYDQAIELIKRAVAPLGEEYVGLIQRAKDERWIDVYPNQNKVTGAYEVCFYGFHPLVLTNFDGGLEDVFTLAHELGHAMHSFYSNRAQNRERIEYTIFVAEVASTTNEMLLLYYLLSQAKSQQERDRLFDRLFTSVKSTIFRQAMFAEFEEKVHAMHEAGQGLTKDKLCGLYYDLNKQYFGSGVKLLPEVKYEWARIPHFFTPFYVYKYATGLICALNFSQRLFSGERGAREEYIQKFLSAGCSKKPTEILQDAGCDLLDERTYTKTFAYLRERLEEYARASAQ